MKTKIKILIITGFWSLLICLNLFKADADYSFSERRKLAAMPDFNISNIMSTKFMNDFETYALDQFYLRDSFRQIKTLFSMEILQQNDYHDVYVNNGFASKIEYPLSEYSLNYVTTLFNNIKDLYLQDNNIYLSIIPDKHYYSDGYYPSIDYDYFVEYINNNLDFKYIDIFDNLSLTDYYHSDPHWNQTCIQDVASEILLAMNKEMEGNFKVEHALSDFNGLYQSQLGLTLNKESISYLTNDIIENALVTDLITGEVLPVYNYVKLDAVDPYDFFLSGAMPLLEITNEDCDNDDELIIFRDSYGSSITPLLIPNYKKITMIDVRYINSDFLGDYIDFKDKEVLFLYSTTVLNNSSTLR